MQSNFFFIIFTTTNKPNLTTNNYKIMEDLFENIEKEQISALHFPPNEVLETKEDIKQRTVDLNRAMTLGNLEHLKMKIYFEDDAAKRRVDTTIWGVTDEKIILKQGVVIPIHRIYKIV